MLLAAFQKISKLSRTVETFSTAHAADKLFLFNTYGIKSQI